MAPNKRAPARSAGLIGILERFQLALVLLREGLFDEIEPLGQSVRVSFDGGFGFAAGLFDRLLHGVLLLLKIRRLQRAGFHVRFVRRKGRNRIRGLND